MNKLMTAAVLAGGLMLLNSPEAAAHKEVRHVYQPYAHVRVDVSRSHHMPRWLRRNKAFRQWYRHTPLRHDHRIGWQALFDIYSWEHRRGRSHYRADNHWNGYYVDRYGERHYDRDHRHRH